MRDGPSGHHPLFLNKDFISKDKYPHVMAENLIELNLGEYKVGIDKNRFDIDQINPSNAIITAKNNLDLKAILSIETVSRGLDRDSIWKDTELRDTSGILHKMMTASPEATITGINSKLVVNGNPGFDVFSINSGIGLAAYRICYWLDGDDAINIFATFPEGDNIKDAIVALATSLRIDKS